MTKTTTMIAMIAGLTLGSAHIARAQTDPSVFVSISAGGQLQSHDFSTASTFPLFNETATIDANQTVGSGFVFDASVGYRVWRRLSVAVGVSTFSGSGAATSLVSIPDPSVFGKHVVKTIPASDYGDLSQTNTAVNFQAVWIQPLTDKLDLWLSGGPSVIHVTQDVASATETQAATATVREESATTAKAGAVGVDLSYRMNERYSVGGFVRYLGGEVDLPSVSSLKVGGLQVGGGVRFRF